MSPHEMGPYREALDKAAAIFGWTKETITVEHEQDWQRSWEEETWLDCNGHRLFSESYLEEGLLKELIRIADKLDVTTKDLSSQAHKNAGY